MVPWELKNPSWRTSPNSDSILRSTQDKQTACRLQFTRPQHHLQFHEYSLNEQPREECGVPDWVKPGSCLAHVYGMEGHIRGGLDEVQKLAKQHKHLMILFGNATMKTKT